MKNLKGTAAAANNATMVNTYNEEWCEFKDQKAELFETFTEEQLYNAALEQHKEYPFNGEYGCRIMTIDGKTFVLDEYELELILTNIKSDNSENLNQVEISRAMEYIQNLLTSNERTDNDCLSDTPGVIIYAAREDDGSGHVRVDPDVEFQSPIYFDCNVDWDYQNDGLWIWDDPKNVSLSDLEEWLADAVRRCQNAVREAVCNAVQELQVEVEDEGHNAMDLLFSAFGNYASGEADWDDVSNSINRAIDWLGSIASDAKELANTIEQLN